MAEGALDEDRNAGGTGVTIEVALPRVAGGSCLGSCGVISTLMGSLVGGILCWPGARESSRGGGYASGAGATGRIFGLMDLALDRLGASESESDPNSRSSCLNRSFSSILSESVGASDDRLTCICDDEVETGGEVTWEDNLPRAVLESD